MTRPTGIPVFQRFFREVASLDMDKDDLRRYRRFVDETIDDIAVAGRNSAKWNGRATIDYWAGNPWTNGSYSYWKVGQYTKFAGAEREIEGACHFAGEHTSIDFQGYLNGAVETGQRAAGEVITALGG